MDLVLTDGSDHRSPSPRLMTVDGMTPLTVARMHCALSNLVDADEYAMTVDEVADVLGTSEAIAYGIMSNLEFNGCERIPPRPGEYRWRIALAEHPEPGRECCYGIPVPTVDWSGG